MSRSKKPKPQAEVLEQQEGAEISVPSFEKEKTVVLPKGLRKFDKFKKAGG